MPRFDLKRFLAETGLTVVRLASFLQVSRDYLDTVVAGRADLTPRDQEACRLLRRRLSRTEQLPLPFAEPPETFTRLHARLLARARSRAPAKETAERVPSDGRPVRQAARGSRTSAREDF